jgi:hypothetical protein
VQLNNQNFKPARTHFLSTPKGWKGLEGVIPPYWNLILSNSNIDWSNRLQLKTTLITPSTPSARPI